MYGLSVSLLRIGINKRGNAHDKRGNKPLERAEQFKCWRANFTDQNVIREEIKIRLNMGNVCYFFFNVFHPEVL